MLSLILIFALALMPLLISLVLMRRVRRRWQARLRRIESITSYRARSPELTPFITENSELHDYWIGDLSCRYNARSPYIRCAVNPEGPCENCPSYQERYASPCDRDSKTRSPSME